MDTWEKFSISPSEWDKIDKATQMEMIAKRNLDVKYDEYLKNKGKDE